MELRDFREELQFDPSYGFIRKKAIEHAIVTEIYDCLVLGYRYFEKGKCFMPPLPRQDINESTRFSWQIKKRMLAEIKNQGIDIDLIDFSRECSDINPKVYGHLSYVKSYEDLNKADRDLYDKYIGFNGEE